MRHRSPIRISPADSAVTARAALQAATSGAHARLHTHPAFSALATGTIDREGYRVLLARLYGFHAPLERRLQAVSWDHAFGLTMSRRRRIHRLRLDLHDLNVPPDDIAALPCIGEERLPHMDRPGRLLGCLYVREGATLGGRVLARALDRLFGPRGCKGRRFLGGADGDAALWRDCCAAIEAAARSGHLAEIAAAASETFEAFEGWFAPGA